MKEFQEFVANGDVRKGLRDIALARSLKEFSEKRIKYAQLMPLTEQSAFLTYETVYDALRELIDSLLALEGYKSYSHVASIAYLQKFPDISPAEIAKLDNAREKRNLAKYYAKPITLAEAKDIRALHSTLKPKLLLIFQRLLC
ncbi:MAG: hypothetical protein HY363_04545 [Candidatus Aenigmarchaeota archaeon]|nr:hypothetical protein [Candidatus Aenigmarchaeota archaeon]